MSDGHQPEDHEEKIQALIRLAQRLGHQAFQEIIALNRWPEGKPLEEEELPLVMQALIRYESKFLPIEQRTGFINQASRHSKRTPN